MGVAEEGVDRDVTQFPVVGELGAVVEGDGLAQGGRQGGHDGGDGVGDERGGSVGWPLGDEEARGALMEGQHALAIGREQHGVGLPMAGAVTPLHLAGPLCNGNTALDEACAAAALAAVDPAFGLSARQVVAPGIVVVAADLGIDEAVDGLVADDRVPGLEGQAPRHLLWRAALGEGLEDGRPEFGLAVELGALPAPGLGLFGSKGRTIAHRAAGIALQLPRNARWRAIQSCSDLAERTPLGL